MKSPLTLGNTQDICADQEFFRAIKNLANIGCLLSDRTVLKKVTRFVGFRKQFNSRPPDASPVIALLAHSRSNLHRSCTQANGLFKCVASAGIGLQNAGLPPLAMQPSKQDVDILIDSLDPEGKTLNAMEAEARLTQVFSYMLGHKGYTVQSTNSQNDTGFDAIAKRPADDRFAQATVGIQFKYSPRPGRIHGAPHVRELVGAAVMNGIDRAILVSNGSYSQAAKDVLTRAVGLDVQLMDIDALRTWANSLPDKSDELSDDTETAVRALVKAISSKFAILTAHDPTALDHLEWRDVERMLAEVFEGLGFQVELTPSSKDGGKDLILQCFVGPTKATYIVEIKHWRSSTRVGHSAVTNFVHVIANEKREGGLFLSTYGYCDNAFEQLSEIERQRIRFGAKEKVVALCRIFEKRHSSLWTPPASLVEMLYENTVIA